MMTSRTIAERKIDTKDFFDEDPEQEIETLYVAETIEKCVFLIPGIRSDRSWAHSFKIKNKFYSETNETSAYTIGPNSRMHILDVVFRMRNSSFKQAFKRQILDTAEKLSANEVNIVAHSLGSAILAEIIEELSKDLSKQGTTIDKVIFLGSICHKKWSKVISDNCNEFINHVGVKDCVTPFADFLNPKRYSHVGTFGFENPYVEDYRFSNDHTSCTSLEHLQDYVLPIINNKFRADPLIPKPKLSLNQVAYIQNTGYFAAFLAVLLLGYFGLWT